MSSFRKNVAKRIDVTKAFRNPFSSPNITKGINVTSNPGGYTFEITDEYQGVSPRQDIEQFLNRKGISSGWSEGKFYYEIDEDFSAFGHYYYVYVHTGKKNKLGVATTDFDKNEESQKWWNKQVADYNKGNQTVVYLALLNMFKENLPESDPNTIDIIEWWEDLDNEADKKEMVKDYYLKYVKK